MNNVFLTCALTLIVISSNAQTGLPLHKDPKQDLDDTEVFHVTKNLETLKYCQLRFIGYDEQVAEIKKDGELKLLTPEQIQEKIDGIKYRSKLFFIIKRSTADAIDMQYYTVVVRNMKDEELFRGKPEGGNIRLDRTTGILYRGYAIVGIPEGFSQQCKVYVIDEIGEVRHEFYVRPGATKLP